VIDALVVALAVGLGNLAAAVGIGVSGVDKRTRLKVGLAFGGFETVMPLLGLVLGRQLSGPLGSAASALGGGLLIATGLWGVVSARRVRDEEPPHEIALGRLLLVGAALSIDNLLVGLALGASDGSLVVALVAIALVSVVMTLLGLELGSRLGARAERYAGELGAGLLILVGIALLCGLH
jgi:putative Mn2+ efflux pump MntP